MKRTAIDLFAGAGGFSLCNGKKMPICKDEKGNWISHFASCPKAAMFRRRTDYILKTDGICTDERRLPKI